MKKLVLSALLLAIAGCSSNSTTDNASDDALIAAKEKAGYECKRQKVTGSRMPQRICTTKAQRDERSENDQEALRRMQTNTGISSAGGN